jgi:hypothetical protein
MLFLYIPGVLDILRDMETIHKPYNGLGVEDSCPKKGTVHKQFKTALTV